MPMRIEQTAGYRVKVDRKDINHNSMCAFFVRFLRHQSVSIYWKLDQLDGHVCV